MRLSKSQLAVMITLSVIIAALLCFIFLMPGLGFSVTPPHGDNADDGNGGHGGMPVHEKLRAPTPGKADGIVWETRLMGSGDETVMGVYNTQNGLYIFGNATVGDYDFDSYGGFLCVTDADGRITEFKYFAGRMTAVSVTASGFAVATVSEAGTSAEKNAVYSVEGGEIVKKAEPVNTVIDILAVDDTRVAAVTKISSNRIALTEYVTSGENWVRDRSTEISSAFGLDYFDCYIAGEEYVVAARTTSLPQYDAVMFFSFKAGGDPTVHTYGGSDENMLTPYAVMPYSGGYAVLAKRGGTATVVGVDYAFKSYRRDILDFAADDARLVFDGKRYYACFITGSGAVTYALDDELKTGEKLGALDGMTLNKAMCAPATFFAASATKLTVTDKSGANKTEFEMTGVNVHACFVNTDGTKTVVLSSTGGNALTVPTGGRDVYVIKMRN